MLIHAQTFSHQTLISPRNISSSQYLKYSPPQRFINVFYRNGERNRMVFFSVSKSSSRRKSHQCVCFSASDEWSSDIESENSELRKSFCLCLDGWITFRACACSFQDVELNSGKAIPSNETVVEHLFLLKAKGDLSDEEEKEMLDYLYTTQYQMSGIIALSLGRLSNQNPDGYTHAVYMRFQNREDLVKFYTNSFYLGVLKDHVMPYCHGVLSMDYESEVEDDVLAIFRKGQEFNYGVEFMLLLSVVGSTHGERIEDALAAHANLASESPSLIVQSTQGSNFNLSNTEYTHAVVIRFRSTETFNMFVGSSEYRDMWASKFESVVKKTLAVHFSIDPVGDKIM